MNVTSNRNFKKKRVQATGRFTACLSLSLSDSFCQNFDYFKCPLFTSPQVVEKKAGEVKALQKEIEVLRSFFSYFTQSVKICANIGMEFWHFSELCHLSVVMSVSCIYLVYKIFCVTYQVKKI